MADDLHASRTGLESAAGGAIKVITGIHTGNVQVTLEPHAEQPEAAPGWERQLLVTPLMDDPADLPPWLAKGRVVTGCASARAAETTPSTRPWSTRWSRPT